MNPAYTEDQLAGILETALDALESGKRGHIYRRNEPWHFNRDIERLNACCPNYALRTEDDYWNIILDCLESAQLCPLQCYKPPQEPTCSHGEALGETMHAFVVELEDFTRPIYTKFCLTEHSDGTWYISIDCHT